MSRRPFKDRVLERAADNGGHAAANDGAHAVLVLFASRDRNGKATGMIGQHTCGSSGAAQDVIARVWTDLENNPWLVVDLDALLRASDAYAQAGQTWKTRPNRNKGTRGRFS